MKLKWKITFLLIFSAFTIIFLRQLFINVNLNFIQSLFSSVNYPILLLGLIIYFFMNFLRTTRFRRIYDKEVTIPTMWSINSYHNFLNHTIPYRMGEFSHIYFMKNQNIGVSRSFSSLLYLRLLDFIISGIFMLVMAIITISWFINPIIYLVVGFFTGILSIILFIFLNFSSKFIELPQKVLNFFKRNKQKNNIQDSVIDTEDSQKGLIHWIQQKLTDFNEKLEIVKKTHSFKSFFGMSVLIKIFQLLGTVVIFYAMNVKLPIFVIITNDLILAYIEFIPLSLVAGLGFYEFTFSFLIQFQNIPLIHPFNIGFAWHLISLFFQTAVLLSGLIVSLVKKIGISKHKKN